MKNNKSQRILDEIIKAKLNGYEISILESEREYEEFAKTLGGKFMKINLSNRGVLNPFLIATENAITIDEKETELRKLLDISDDGAEYARQRLNDMSFLDDYPEWKERAILILREYAQNTNIKK